MMTTKPLVAMAELTTYELWLIARAYGGEIISDDELQTITALLESKRTRTITPEER